MSEVGILIVEDETIVSEQIATYLASIGHTITGRVTNGEPAVVQAEENLSDIVPTDIRLDGPLDGPLDGREATRQIQAVQDCQCGFLTAGVDAEQSESQKLTRAAVWMAGQTACDLILADIQWPGIDGLEAMRRVREAALKPVPSVAVTAFAMKGDADKYLAAGFDDYISKPMDVDRLKRITQSFC